MSIVEVSFEVDVDFISRAEQLVDDLKSGKIKTCAIIFCDSETITTGFASTSSYPHINLGADDLKRRIMEDRT